MSEPDDTPTRLPSEQVIEIDEDGNVHYPDELTELRAEVSRLREALNVSNSVCACGCPIGEHENYGEDGEACETEDHECVRTSAAVADMLELLRADVSRLQQELHEKNQAGMHAVTEISRLQQEHAKKDLTIAAREVEIGLLKRSLGILERTISEAEGR